MAILTTVTQRSDPGTVTRLQLNNLTRAEGRMVAALHPPAANAIREAQERITLPPDPALAERLASALPGIEWASDACEWYARERARAREARALAHAGDSSELIYPWISRMYPYQRTGAAWLKHVGRGILGDSPGLGKTIQSLTAVADLAHVLIVTLPTVESHWQRIIHDWLGREVPIAQGTHAARQTLLDTRPDWVIVNHEMLRPGATGYNHLLSRPWDAVIIDEAHKFQGRKSLQSRGAQRLKTPRLLMLTGTPIWNRPDSLWHLLHLLQPARFSSYWTFVGAYCDVVEGYYGVEVVGVQERKLPELQTLLAEFVLKREKTSVLPDLPAKIVQDIDYDLTPTQRAAYRSITRDLTLRDRNGVVTTYPNAGAALYNLRLLCDAPALLNVAGDSPKDAVIDELLDTLLGEGRKVTLFTWHKTYAEYLADRLSALGTALVTGDTPDRDATLQAWRRDTTPILVATIGAVGTGIDLIEATAAIFAEGSYVPTLNTQAEDRLHRIGIKDSPLIYRLAARASVESVIWDISDTRRDLSDEMLAEALVRKAVFGE